MQNRRKLPVYHRDSAEPLSLCSPLSLPSSAGRCRSVGQWLARHSCPCTPRVHQSPASCCPRNLPLDRTRHRISAWAWPGSRSPSSERKLALPRRSTSLPGGWLWLGLAGCSCTDARSLSLLCCPVFSPSLSAVRLDSHRLCRFSIAGGRTVTKAGKNQ